jgi:hypothetical protein
LHIFLTHTKNAVSSFRCLLPWGPMKCSTKVNEILKDLWFVVFL